MKRVRLTDEARVQGGGDEDDPAGWSAPGIVHRMSYFCMPRIRTGESANRHPHVTYGLFSL